MLFGVIFFSLIILAWNSAFIQDDAFISFRYAANLTNGHGLVWNPGERVEGYSNFLWTLLMVIPHALGFGPVIFSKILGMIFFSGSLAFTYITAKKLFNSQASGLTVMTILGSNYSFSAYATGGLETQLQTFLIILGVYFALLIKGHPEDSGKRILFSLVSASAILTRLDSGLPFFFIYIFILIDDFRSGTLRNHKTVDYLTLLLTPAAFLILPWLIWKYSYYGSLLPNTFMVKAASPSFSIFKQGVLYVSLFFNSYLLIPILFLGLLFFKNIFKNQTLLPLIIILFFWIMYVVFVGGDFMEFRFLIPVLPLLFLLLYAIIHHFQTPLLRILLIFLIFGGSWHHYSTFQNRHGVESIASLEAHVISEAENWIVVGMKLKDLFGKVDDVRIATTAAGAIPYYSGLYSVDMHGLNDAWVARHGIYLSDRPGHQRIAPLSYLLYREVNLLIGQPMVLPRGIRPEEHPAFGELEI